MFILLKEFRQEIENNLVRFLKKIILSNLGRMHWRRLKPSQQVRAGCMRLVMVETERGEWCELPVGGDHAGGLVAWGRGGEGDPRTVLDEAMAASEPLFQSPNSLDRVSLRINL